MFSYPQEFVMVCRQLGEAQQRCSAALAAQAAQIESLQAEVVRLRGAVVLRDTRLALAQEALVAARAAEPGLPRRKAMARHIAALAERIGALSRECLRWRLAADVVAMAVRPVPSGEAIDPVAGHLQPATHLQPAAHGCALDRTAFDALVMATDAAVLGAGEGERVSELLGVLPDAPDAPDALDGQAPDSALIAASLAAADLVICQTGCISHDEYWRVQDHCRRTGKPCILVDQPLAVREAHAHALAHSPSHATPATEPAVILRMTRPRRAVEVLVPVESDSASAVQSNENLNEISR